MRRVNYTASLITDVGKNLKTWVKKRNTKLLPTKPVVTQHISTLYVTKSGIGWEFYGKIGNKDIHYSVSCQIKPFLKYRHVVLHVIKMNKTGNVRIT